MGTKNFVQRSAITAQVTAFLESTNRPVGLGEAPRGGVAGWQGDPNEPGTTFIPYSVLTPMTASAGTGPFSDSQSDVSLPYALTSYGVTVAQTEDQADLMRAALIRLGMGRIAVPQWPESTETYGRRIQTVIVQSYGQVQRAGQTDPAYYGQTDVYTLMTSA